MRPSAFLKLLAYFITANENLMVTGPPGIGKTDLVLLATQMAKRELIMMHPAISDPTDFKGLPAINLARDGAEFVPFGDLKAIYGAKKPTVVFIDDVGQAMPAVQNGVMQLLHSSTGVRRLNGHIVPKHVCFVLATNRRQDGANVTGMTETVKSRVASIVSLEPNLEDFCAWMAGNNGAPEIVAYLRDQPGDLHKFEKNPDIVNQPMPRTWAAASRILQMGMSSELELIALGGAVGEGMAAKLSGYLRMYRELPTITSILLDPDSAIIPEKPAALYFVAAGVAMQANVGNFGRVARYAERLEETGHAEFAVLLVRDSLRHEKKIANTQGFVKLTTGSNPVGKLIAGEM